MSKVKALQFFIYCQSAELSQWIELTLRLSNLNVDKITAITSLNNESLALRKTHVAIVAESDFKRFLKDLASLSIYSLPFPVLVLTDSFESVKKPAKLKLTLDNLPMQVVTINILEHSINSLLKDFLFTEKLTKLAHFDTLTGAANRLLFEDRLNQGINRVKRFNEPLSLLYFDLDGFKPVNDTYGHHIGDLLLKRFVILIKSIIRDTDTLARMGGDEFALILSNSDLDTLNIMCEKITSVLQKVQQFESVNILIQASIGALSINKAQSLTLSNQQLLKLVDNAVYQAKKIEGTAVVFASTK